MNDGLERDDVYYRLVIVKFIDEIFKNFIEQLFARIIDCSCTYNNMWVFNIYLNGSSYKLTGNLEVIYCLWVYYM